MHNENTENNKYLVGLWDHEEVYMDAIKVIRKSGVEIDDAFTPFPVHGLEHVLEIPDSRLHRAGFLFGITGTTFALTLMTFISANSYPLNIGGKPFFALPSFIPITFELTVLFAAVGMVIVYCIRNGLFPGNVPRIYDERITDDRFALTFAIDNADAAQIAQIEAVCKENGAVETKIKDFEEDGELFD